MLPEELLAQVDAARTACGYLGVEALLAVPGLRVLDPFSTLISPGVRWGAGCVVHPGVVVSATDTECEVGDDTVLHGGTHVSAENGATIRIGRRVTLGPGGAQVKANRAGAVLEIGDDVRVLNGAEVIGPGVIGSGAQVLGAITVIGCELGAGTPFTGSDPDGRGAVLKGVGRAVGMRLAAGDVVNGLGDFSLAPVERQLAYHPKPA